MHVFCLLLFTVRLGLATSQMPVLVQQPFRKREREDIINGLWSSIEEAVESPAAVPEEWEYNSNVLRISTNSKISVPTPPPKIMSPAKQSRGAYRGSPFFKHSKKTHRKKPPLKNVEESIGKDETIEKFQRLELIRLIGTNRVLQRKAEEFSSRLEDHLEDVKQKKKEAAAKMAPRIAALERQEEELDIVISELEGEYNMLREANASLKNEVAVVGPRNEAAAALTRELRKKDDILKVLWKENQTLAVQNRNQNKRLNEKEKTTQHFVERKKFLKERLKKTKDTFRQHQQDQRECMPASSGTSKPQADLRAVQESNLALNKEIVLLQGIKKGFAKNLIATIKKRDISRTSRESEEKREELLRIMKKATILKKSTTSNRVKSENRAKQVEKKTSKVKKENEKAIKKLEQMEQERHKMIEEEHRLVMKLHKILTNRKTNRPSSKQPGTSGRRASDRKTTAHLANSAAVISGRKASNTQPRRSNPQTMQNVN